MATTKRVLTRVAVVQLDYHPAAIVGRRSPLEDPLFRFDSLDALTPEGGLPPVPLESRLRDLRRRIRDVYNEQLLARLRVVLETCRNWQVQLVVLPEYSVPYEILGGLADAAGEMVVVCGTHAVDLAARDSGIYARLGWPELPTAGEAVCPVLYQGRLLALQPKLNPAVPEASLRRGARWAPIEMPAPITGPLGVLVCLDFLYRESDQHQQLVAPHLDRCRFLAVPSLTPHYTLAEFAGRAWEEARRYGRPVLYADIAGGLSGPKGGGSSIYVDEGRVADLRMFPDHAGYLEPGDEGLIVADVDLGYVRTGSSTRYHHQRPIIPCAAASFVYRKHVVGERYAAWLEELQSPPERADPIKWAATHIRDQRQLLLDAAALPGAEVRMHRLRRLLNDLEWTTDPEDIRRFTREVVLPPHLLPLGDLRAALARGAADVIHRWSTELRTLGMEAVQQRLETAAAPARSPDSALWHPDGLAALAEIAQRLQERAGATSPRPHDEPAARIVLPKGINPATLGTIEHEGIVLQFAADPRQLGGQVFVERRPEGAEGVAAGQTPPRCTFVCPDDDVLFGSPSEGTLSSRTLHGRLLSSGFSGA